MATEDDRVIVMSLPALYLFLHHFGYQQRVFQSIDDGESSRGCSRLLELSFANQQDAQSSFGLHISSRPMQLDPV